MVDSALIVEAMSHTPPRERRERNWDLVAYCLRYGHADVSDWPLSEAVSLERALSDIVGRENGKK